MQKTLRYLLIIVTAITFASKAYAQIGRVGINTTTPAAMLHVKDSSVVFTGTFPLPSTPGPPPVSGSGVRMMWYPDKAAFRAGYASGTYWDQQNIGKFSFATGSSSIAKGDYSTALGTSGAYGNYSSAFSHSIATGTYSTSMGNSYASGSAATSMGLFTLASGNYSFASGWYSESIGDASFAIGSATQANGWSSFSTGLETKANPFASMVIGQLNDTSFISKTSWELLDPVFIIGNGTAWNQRSNAFTILKNGMTGINTSSPTSMLHIVNSLPSGGTPHVSSAINVEGHLDFYLQLLNTDITESGILSGNQQTSIRSGLIFKPDSSLQLRSGGNLDRLTIGKTGMIGVNTINPQAMTHILRNNPTNGPYFGNVISIWESDLNSYVQFSNTNTRESGFLSGNDDTAIRSALIFSADSSIVFNSGGNFSNMVLKKNGYLGLGTLSPNDIFHVRKASSGGTGNSNSVGIFENNSSAYLNILTPNANESGLLFGNATTSAHGGIIYNAFSTPNGIQFRTNSNQTRMVINNTGNVGIGTTAPSEKLHVVGDICYTGSIGGCSDVRYKKDFEKIEDVLGKLQTIDAYYYHWNTEKFDSLGFTEEKQIGVIAQEVAKVFPEIVSQDDAGYFRVDYSRLSVILLAALKEQQQITSDQGFTIQKQQIEIESLRDRFDSIEAKLNLLLLASSSVSREP